MKSWTMFAVLLLVTACGAESPWPGGCAPHTVPIAGWKAPYSVTIDDTVVGWYQTEREALIGAVTVARDSAVPVRIASIVEVRFLRDGDGCAPERGATTNENEQTATGRIPSDDSRAGWGAAG